MSRRWWWLVGLLQILGTVSCALADCTVLPPQLPDTPELQHLTSAATQLTVPGDTEFRTIDLNGVGTTSYTLTATPTIVTDVDLASTTITAGRWLEVRNVDANTGNCVTFQDKAVLSGSGLDLGGSTRTLCGGDGPLWFQFDGTNWVAGGLEVYEGVVPPEDKRLINRLYFSPEDFQLSQVSAGSGTGLLVATDPSVTHAGAKIDPSETEADSLGRLFVLKGGSVDAAPNNLTGSVQKLDRFYAVNSSNSTRVSYGAGTGLSTADGELTYSGPYTVAADVATKSAVDAHVVWPLKAYFSSAPSTFGATGHTFLRDGLSKIVAVEVRLPPPVNCTAANLIGYGISESGTWDSNITVTVSLMKNASVVASVILNQASNGAVVVAPSYTSPSYIGGSDYYYFQVTCSGTHCTGGSAPSTLYTMSVAATCIGP